MPGIVGILVVLATMSIAVLSAAESSAAPPDHRATEADDGETEVEYGENAPASVAEARSRARILHETLHGVLQVMHRDFFREDEKLAIPSQSLEDVFKELSRSYGVEMRWLAVNTEAMNVDHMAKTDFEVNAVKALSAGKQEFESTEDGLYRHAGVIRLSSQCLKCHVPRRTSTRDRAAGLIIAMPLKNP